MVAVMSASTRRVPPSPRSRSKSTQPQIPHIPETPPLACAPVPPKPALSAAASQGARVSPRTRPPARRLAAASPDVEDLEAAEAGDLHGSHAGEAGWSVEVRGFEDPLVRVGA